MIYSVLGEQQPAWLPVRHVLPIADDALFFLSMVGVAWVVFVAAVSVLRPRPILALWGAGASAMLAQWLISWFVCGGYPASPFAVPLSIPLSPLPLGGRAG